MTSENQNIKEMKHHQKLRLAYLRKNYFPDMMEIHFFKRLRFSDVVKQYSKTTVDGIDTIEGMSLRWLPDDCKAWSLKTGDAFKKRAIIDKNKEGYVPKKGLEKDLCDALGFVFADEYRHGLDAPLTAEMFNERRKNISSFLFSGTPQPAGIFQNTPIHEAEEITPTIIETSVSEGLKRNYLRGKARHYLVLISSWI